MNLLSLIDRRRLVAEFMEMVQVDSESGGEEKMVLLLQQKLQELGLDVHVAPVGAKANTATGNIIATLKGSVTAPTLLFCGHVDTVTPGCGIVPVEEQGVIRSQGDTILGADNKAGIAAILEAIKVLQDHALPHGDMELVFTVEEETGLTGAKALDFNQLKARMAFILDSNETPGTIINRGPSQDQITATVVGVAAHAGIRPEEGISAIQVAAKAIAAMQLGRIDEETTANIGVITGGRAINIVPEMVTLQGETRSLDEGKRQAQTQAICQQLEKTTQAAGAKLHLDVETIYPAMYVPEDSDIVRLARRAATLMELDNKVQSTGGGSDTHIFNSHGIAALNLGIGMQKVHTTDEYITVHDLMSTAAYVLAMMQTAAEGAY